MKACITCGNVKPLSLFCRDRAQPSGYRGQCKECQRKYARDWRARGVSDENLAKARARSKAWREANLELDRERHRRSANRARNERRARELAARVDRPCSGTGCDVVLVKPSPERLYCSKRCTNRSSEERNREARNEYQRQWRREHPSEPTPERRAKRRVNDQRREARKANLASEHIELVAILDRDGWRCLACGAEVREDTSHLDHCIPVAHGGPWLRWNVEALCAPCNLSKGPRLIEDSLRRALARATG